MNANRTVALLNIEKYRQGKLTSEEKEAFEEQLIALFFRDELTEEQEDFFNDLCFSSSTFFEKVKETEKISLGIKDAARRGVLNFAGARTGRYSILERLQSFWSSPKLVLAAAFIIFAVLIPVRQVFYLKSELRELRKPRAIAVESFALLPDNERLRGEKNEIRLSECADVFILNFNLPKKTIPGYRYEGGILDGDKKVIWEIKNLKPSGPYETFSVYCHKAAFESGEYFVRVFELGAGGEKTGETYMFSFRIVNNG